MIERLEKELSNLQHEMRVKKLKRGSNAYQLILNRQNRIMGALAYARGEIV